MVYKNKSGHLKYLLSIPVIALMATSIPICATESSPPAEQVQDLTASDASASDIASQDVSDTQTQTDAASETTSAETEASAETSAQTTQTDSQKPYVSDSEKYKTTQEAFPDEKGPEELIAPEPNVYGGYDTYAEYLEANKQTELTPEQAAAGMSLNEYGQVEDPSQGEDYSEVIFGGVNPGENTGYIVIQVSTDAEIHEEMYVNVMNLNTYKIYGCRLYEINAYSTQMCLPAGNYIVQDAGLTLDSVGRFYTYNRQFRVNKDSTQILDVPLIDTREEAQKRNAENLPDAATLRPDADGQGSAEDTTSQQVIPQTDPNTHEVNQENLEVKPKGSILSIIIAILIIVGVFYVLYKLFPPRPKQESRGFDE